MLFRSFVGVGFTLSVLFERLYRAERGCLELTSRMAATEAAADKLAEANLELARIQSRMKDSEERFQATFNQAAVGLAHVNLEGRCIRVNQRLCDMLRYEEAELLQKTVADVTHPKDLQRTLKEAQRVVAGEIQTYRIEKNYLRKDGTVLPASVTSSLARNAVGEPLYFIAVIEDITGRRHAAEVLEENLMFRREAAKIARIGAS